MNPKELVQLNAILDGIYCGATDADVWADVLPLIANWLGAPMALLFTPLTPPPQGGFVVPHRISQATLDTWAESKHATDLWSSRAMERGLMRDENIILDHELATESELRASAWYMDFLHARNIARLMTGIVFGTDNSARLCTALSLFRGWSEPAFDRQAKARFGILMPHLSRALGLMMTLRGTELRLACTHAALNRLNVGVVLINTDESIGFANYAAERLFREADGIAVRSDIGVGKLRLNISNEASAEVLRLALREALDRRVNVAHFNEKIQVRRPSERPPYLIQLSPCTDVWAAGQMFGVPCAVLLIVDPTQQHGIDSDALCRLYGLTATESKVAVALLEDDKAECVAATLGIELSTLRSHMARVYEKTGVNSRVGLMRLLLGHTEP